MRHCSSFSISTTLLRTWREAIKEHYRRRMERILFDPSVSDAESYRRMRDAVDLLSNKDRSVLVEGCYKARRLSGGDVTDAKQQQEYTECV